jgi:hypothetical protein
MDAIGACDKAVNRNTKTPYWSLWEDNEQKYKDAILELEAVISQGTERRRHTLVPVISQLEEIQVPRLGVYD